MPAEGHSGSGKAVRGQVVQAVLDESKKELGMHKLDNMCIPFAHVGSAQREFFRGFAGVSPTSVTTSSVSQTRSTMSTLVWSTLLAAQRMYARLVLSLNGSEFEGSQFVVSYSEVCPSAARAVSFDAC